MVIRIGKSQVSVKCVEGFPFGTIFEEQDKTLVPVEGGLFPDPVAPEVGDFEVPTNDNRSYTDTNDSQKLSNHEIAALRAQGVNGSALIAKLVENSDTWDTKTEFSKQKYLKKKQQKYMPRIQMVRCTAIALCDVYHSRQPAKILNLRYDIIGQILSYGNIYADQQVNDSIVYFPFHYIGQLDQDEATLVATESTAYEAEVAAQVSLYTDEEQKKYLQKKELRKLKQRQAKPKKSPTDIRTLLRTPSDSLVIVSHYDPLAMLLQLLPNLGLSRPFVVYCEYLEPLTSAFDALQRMDSIINLQLNDTWTREYQILPGRTHPEMTMSAGSGYLLSGIKVEATPAPAHLADLKVLPRRTNAKK
ncbi:hypothetical protein DYB28_007955, partial [Aphanomyces astaci]